MQIQANEGNRQARRRAVLLLGGSLLALALPLTWRPSTSIDGPGDPTALVVLAADWLAWALTVYLAVGTGVAAAGHLTRTAQPLGRLAPAAVRRCVEVAVGASTAAAVCLAPSAAFAAPPAPAPTAAASPLDWPALAAAAAPAAAQPHESAAAAPKPQAAATTRLVVRPGDSLWSVTARELGRRATPARIAAAWPRLYAANRRVIGSDPNLIHPGQQLVPPTPQERTSP